MNVSSSAGSGSHSAELSSSGYGSPSAAASVEWQWSYGLLVAAFVLSSVATIASAHILYRGHGGSRTRVVAYVTLCSVYSFAGQLAPSLFFIAALQPSLGSVGLQPTVEFDADLLLESGAASIVSVALAAALIAGVDPYRPTRLLYLRVLLVALLLSIGNVTMVSLLLLSVQSSLQLHFDFSGGLMFVLVFGGAAVWLLGLIAVSTALFSHYLHTGRLCLILSVVLAAVLLAQQRLVVLSVSASQSTSAQPLSPLSYTGLIVLAVLLAGVSLLWFTGYASFMAAMRSREAVKTRSLTLAALLFDPTGRVLVTPLSTLPSVVVDTAYVGAGVFDANNRDFLNFLKTSFSWDKASPSALLTLIQSRKTNYSLELYLKFAQAANRLLQDLVGKEAAAAVSDSKTGTGGLELLGVMFPSPLIVRDGGMLVVCSRTLTAEEAARLVGVHNTLQWARRDRVEREIYAHYSPHGALEYEEPLRTRQRTLTSTVQPYVAMADEGRHRSASGFECEEGDAYIDQPPNIIGAGEQRQHHSSLPAAPLPVSSVSPSTLHPGSTFVLSRYHWLDNVSAFVRSSCQSSLPPGLYLGLFYAKVSGSRLDVLVSKSKLHSIPMVPVLRRRHLLAAAHSERHDSVDIDAASTASRVQRSHRRGCRDEELEWIQSLRSSAEAVEEATLAGLPASTASLLTSAISDQRRLALIRYKMSREADFRHSTAHAAPLDASPNRRSAHSRSATSSVSSSCAPSAARPVSSSNSSLTQFQADFYCAAEQLHSKLGTDADLLPSRLHPDVILADGSGRVQLVLMVHSAFSSAFPAGYDSNNHMFVPVSHAASTHTHCTHATTQQILGRFSAQVYSLCWLSALLCVRVVQLEVFEAFHRHRWHLESGAHAAPVHPDKLSPSPPGNAPRRSAFHRTRGLGAAHHAKVWSSLLRIARENRDLMHAAIQRLSETADKLSPTLASSGLLHLPAAASPSQQRHVGESVEALSRIASPLTSPATLSDDQRGSLSAIRAPHSPVTATLTPATDTPLRLMPLSSPNLSSLRHARQKSVMLLQRLAARAAGRDDAANGNHHTEATAGADSNHVAAASLPPSPSLSSRGGVSISLSRGEINSLTPLLRTVKQDAHLTQRLWTMLRRHNSSTQQATLADGAATAHSLAARSLTHSLTH